MAICWQKPDHFPVTIAQDIAFGDLDRAGSVPGSVEEAARLGGAHEFISALPDAYETTMRALDSYEDDTRTRARARHRRGHVGVEHKPRAVRPKPHENVSKSQAQQSKPFLPPPVNFSGGQWQRLSLSRTMMRVPVANVLAFDEPSASLDPKAEHELFESLHDMKHNKTCIFVTHRFGAFNRQANKIFLMDKGKVIEQGTHDALMAREDGLYQKLYGYQVSSFAPTSSAAAQSSSSLS